MRQAMLRVGKCRHRGAPEPSPLLQSVRGEPRSARAPMLTSPYCSERAIRVSGPGNKGTRSASSPAGFGLSSPDRYLPEKTEEDAGLNSAAGRAAQ